MNTETAAYAEADILQYMEHHAEDGKVKSHFKGAVHGDVQIEIGDGEDQAEPDQGHISAKCAYCAGKLFEEEKEEVCRAQQGEKREGFVEFGVADVIKHAFAEEKIGCQSGESAKKPHGTRENAGSEGDFCGERLTRDENKHGNQPKNGQGCERLIDTMQGVILEIVDFGIKNTHEINDAQNDRDRSQRNG